MATKVRVNLANPLELQQLPGISPQQVDAIVKFRAEHGPIKDAAQLATIIGAGTAEQVVAQVDFAPSDSTAPEAPGA
jgi:competence ComEA-like helix-hairpin-helix protein